MVLMLSCGVIASPDREKSSIPLLDMSILTGETAGRADALMFIEFRGRASENITTVNQTAPTPQVANQNNSPTRGRY
jgi:hypothetical protein